MKYVDIFDFLTKVTTATINHLVWLLGPIFIFGLLLHLLARFTRNTYIKSVGTKLDVIITGWIGTPIHELGHALFCILFRHRIVEMKLYSPDPSSGTLGHVSHTYNSKSRYQKIGNFFIGIGPILFGAVVLYALMYFLMPEMLAMGSWQSILSGIFDRGNLLNWHFWVFLYLSFCIASHMELSPADIKGAGSGLITFIITIFIFNFLVIGAETLGIASFAGKYWRYIKLETYSSYINGFLSRLGTLLTYALIISGLNFVLSYICLSIYSLIKYKRLLNPLTSKIP